MVVPRMDPETGETYGVTTHLRLQDPPAPAGVRSPPRDGARCRGVVDRARRPQPHADRRLRGVAAARRLRRPGVPRSRARAGSSGPSGSSSGRVEQVAEPGDFLALDVAGEQVIVVRNRSGEHQRPLRRLPPSRLAPDDAPTSARTRPPSIRDLDDADDPWATSSASPAPRVRRDGSRASSAAPTTPGATSSTARVRNAPFLGESDDVRARGVRPLPGRGRRVGRLAVRQPVAGAGRGRATRWRRSWARSRRASRATRWPTCGPRAGSSTTSGPTGRSSSRTTTSATTARASTRSCAGSCRRSARRAAATSTGTPACRRPRARSRSR